MKRYKKEESVSYTLGASLTFQLLERHQTAVKAVYLHPQFTDGENKTKIKALCAQTGVLLTEGEKAFNILSPKENCFLIGEFEKFEAPISPLSNHVVLVCPSNAGNLGTILRSCLGFGFRDIALIRPCTDIFDPKTVRASMGALFGVRFSFFDSFEEYRAVFGERSFYPFMLQSSQPLFGVRFHSPYSLVFGNEASGLPDTFLKLGQTVRIEQSEEVDSLNLSVAVSVALYEASRQRED